MGQGSVKGWIITGYVFSAFYILIGLMQFPQGKTFTTILGVFALICGVLFGAGSFLASKGNFGTAKVLMIIGGIPALPLGVVMIIAGVKIGKAAPGPQPLQPGQSLSAL